MLVRSALTRQSGGTVDRRVVNPTYHFRARGSKSAPKLMGANRLAVLRGRSIFGGRRFDIELFGLGPSHHRNGKCDFLDPAEVHGRVHQIPVNVCQQSPRMVFGQLGRSLSGKGERNRFLASFRLHGRISVLPVLLRVQRIDFFPHGFDIALVKRLDDGRMERVDANNDSRIHHGLVGLPSVNGSIIERIRVD